MNRQTAFRMMLLALVSVNLPGCAYHTTRRFTNGGDQPPLMKTPEQLENLGPGEAVVFVNGQLTRTLVPPELTVSYMASGAEPTPAHPPKQPKKPKEAGKPDESRKPKEPKQPKGHGESTEAAKPKQPKGHGESAEAAKPKEPKKPKGQEESKQSEPKKPKNAGGEQQASEPKQPKAPKSPNAPKQPREKNPALTASKYAWVAHKLQTHVEIKAPLPNDEISILIEVWNYGDGSFTGDITVFDRPPEATHITGLVGTVDVKSNPLVYVPYIGLFVDRFVYTSSGVQATMTPLADIDGVCLECHNVTIEPSHGLAFKFMMKLPPYPGTAAK